MYLKQECHLFNINSKFEESLVLLKQKSNYNKTAPTFLKPA